MLCPQPQHNTRRQQLQSGTKRPKSHRRDCRCSRENRGNTKSPKRRICALREIPARVDPSCTSLASTIPRKSGQSRSTRDNGPLPVTLPPEDLWFEPLHFSAMSDNQIVDAVNRAGTAFGASIPDVPLDDMLNWDWLDFANPDFNF